MSSSPNRETEKGKSLNSSESSKEERKSNEEKRSSKPTSGSLLGLFQSEYFNVHMLFQYLFKSQQEGVTQYLIDKLYNESVVNLDYYLPQIWYDHYCYDLFLLF